MVKVTIIEPNKNHQNLFADILRKESFDVTVLKDYLLTENILTNCPLNKLPDIIIIGYDVPIENSMKITHFIRKHFYFSRIKILKLCPNKTNEAGLKLIEAGVDSYINLKDFTPSLFVTKIKATLLMKSRKDKVLKTTIQRESEIECSSEQSGYKYDYMLLDFPDENKVNEYVSILEKIFNSKKSNLNLCVVTNETIYNTINTKTSLPNNIVCLLKPLSRTKIFKAMDKLATNIESQIKVTQNKCQIG